MKKILSLFVLMTISWLAAAQTATAQAKNNDFAKMTFEATLSKNTYLLLEPMLVKFRFANQTTEPQTTLTPEFLQESQLKITLNGKTTVFNYLSSFTGLPNRFDVTFVPGKAYESEEILGSSFVGEFFPQAGEYQIQFILTGVAGTQTLESDVIDVMIEEPTGLNKQAFDFLKSHQEFFGLSSWDGAEKRGEALLKTLVEKYGDSVYSEPAISSLGHIYEYRGELEKAEALFKRLESSKNKSVAADAKRVLAEIERKIEVEKSKLNNR